MRQVTLSGMGARAVDRANHCHQKLISLLTRMSRDRQCHCQSAQDLNLWSKIDDFLREIQYQHLSNMWAEDMRQTESEEILKKCLDHLDIFGWEGEFIQSTFSKVWILMCCSQHYRDDKIFFQILTIRYFFLRFPISITTKSSHRESWMARLVSSEKIMLQTMMWHGIMWWDRQASALIYIHKEMMPISQNTKKRLKTHQFVVQTQGSYPIFLSWEQSI